MKKVMRNAIKINPVFCLVFVFVISCAIPVFADNAKIITSPGGNKKTEENSGGGSSPASPKTANRMSGSFGTLNTKTSGESAGSKVVPPSDSGSKTGGAIAAPPGSGAVKSPASELTKTTSGPIIGALPMPDDANLVKTPDVEVTKKTSGPIIGALPVPDDANLVKTPDVEVTKKTSGPIIGALPVPDTSSGGDGGTMDPPSSDSEKAPTFKERKTTDTGKGVMNYEDVYEYEEEEQKKDEDSEEKKDEDSEDPNKPDDPNNPNSEDPNNPNSEEDPSGTSGGGGGDPKLPPPPERTAECELVTPYGASHASFKLVKGTNNVDLSVTGNCPPGVETYPVAFTCTVDGEVVLDRAVDGVCSYCGNGILESENSEECDKADPSAFGYGYACDDNCQIVNCESMGYKNNQDECPADGCFDLETNTQYRYVINCYECTQRQMGQCINDSSDPPPQNGCFTWKQSCNVCAPGHTAVDSSYDESSWDECTAYDPAACETACSGDTMTPSDPDGNCEYATCQYNQCLPEEDCTSGDS